MQFLSGCLGSLPFLCLFLTIFWLRCRKAGSTFVTISDGALIWSAAILLETNLLSFLDLIGRPAILSFWLLYTAIILWLFVTDRRKLHLDIKITRSRIPFVLILALTLTGALAYAPDYHDSLAYHLPRVMYWLQNGSLAPWPTSIDRQIGMAPFNAMVILQSMASGKNDWFVNLPQWLAFAGSIAGVMRIAHQLGATPGARLCAGLFFCTLPIAIMQSGNSESGLIATFWLCVFASSFLAWRKNANMADTLRIGCALGLAILSKGTAYPVALPFVACIAWDCLRQFKSRFLYGVLAACLVIAINIPHFYRNYTATHSLVLSAERNIILKPTPALIAVNAWYNFLSQEPWLIYIYSKKNWSALAARLGVDDHDPEYFPWRGIEYSRDNLVPSDIDGQSPVHALLILFFIPWLVWRRPAGTALYTGLLCTAFFIFFTLITWQPWAARLHLPFFMLAAPLIGIGIAAMTRRWLRAGILALMGATAIMPLFFCLEHPLGPPALLANYREDIRHFAVSSRDEQYFNFWRHMRKGYMAAVEYLAAQKPASIGVDLADDGQEYPLWGMLAKRLEPLPRISHSPAPYPQDGPEYIFRQHHSSFSELPDPVVLKKTPDGYRQVFPAAGGQS